MLKPEEARRPLTVSELALEIRRQLRPLTAVLVKGEVSGMKKSARGHYSFSIRDAASRVDAFIFADDVRRLPMVPEDGQEFIFRGRVDFWAQIGALRLIVEYLEFDEAGRLRARLEELKRRLEAEGAFELSRKRRLPFLPGTVALLTSPTGAVIHDLQETILDRFPNIGIAVYPVQVQGVAAPASVASALRRCNRDGDAEVAVIARGGGSFEELYAFNTEVVARAILASRIPVVTALGHTSDRTLADMVADLECRTPTEAGARVVPRKSELLARLAERERRLQLVLPSLLGRRRDRLERGRAELLRLSPAHQLARRREGLGERGQRLQAAAERWLRRRRQELAGRTVEERLSRRLQERLRAAASGLDQRTRRLAALSPEARMAAGYSIVSDTETGRILRSAAETARGRRLRVRLASGRLGARVEEVEA
ncbi:MAG TPA: exodeoxyribonuclease VII large subunit [Candidatus Acidoferrales bacterium]|nr:exodeoxyribonuclease VII large subunit [Candidatus Acidoferrales bacterium]